MNENQKQELIEDAKQIRRSINALNQKLADFGLEAVKLSQSDLWNSLYNAYIDIDIVIALLDEVEHQAETIKTLPYPTHRGDFFSEHPAWFIPADGSTPVKMSVNGYSVSFPDDYTPPSCGGTLIFTPSVDDIEATG